MTRGQGGNVGLTLELGGGDVRLFQIHSIRSLAQYLPSTRSRSWKAASFFDCVSGNVVQMAVDLDAQEQWKSI